MEEEAEVEDEVSLEEMLRNQLNTCEKLFVRRAHGMLFGDDGDAPSVSSEPRTPESRRHSDKESSADDDDDDFWM
jgi:hypothetical protein